MDRIPISKKLRFDVFKRDRFQCAYCGAHPSETVLLEIDHIRAITDGGTNEIDNLVTACFDCNRGKGAAPLTSIPQSLEEKASEVAEREAQIRAYYEILETKRRRKDDELYSIADLYVDRFGDEYILRSRLASIRTFLDRLNYYSRGAAFRYFCGVCWNKIKNGDDNGQ